MAPIDRRTFLALGAGAFAVAMSPLAFRPRRGLVRRMIPVMGTLAEVAVVHPDAALAEEAIDAAFSELRSVDARMSRFSAMSDVGRLNSGGARGPVAVAPETARVLAEALRWARATDGLFDPCIGRAIELWDVNRRHEPPPEGDVRRWAGRHLHRSLELDTWRGAPVARFTDGDVAVDLGGIAKGYAVDRAVDALRARGITRAFVNAGGDLYAMGASEDGDKWQVGVQSAKDPSRVERVLSVEDEAVATSGDYLQGFRCGGRRYHHLLDPASGEPWRTDGKSLTIAAARCIDADAAATAFFGAPSADASLRGADPSARVA
ncbi:MAG TPA: FAD:protein FMN transferase [Planctomycetota bacterium]|nr:FAD:protein FMN transferase [Planctomycetota bacterium]